MYVTENKCYFVNIWKCLYGVLFLHDYKHSHDLFVFYRMQQYSFSWCLMELIHTLYTCMETCTGHLRSHEPFLHHGSVMKMVDTTTILPHWIQTSQQRLLVQATVVSIGEILVNLKNEIVNRPICIR